ncbi:hypothetical protein [Serratia quinivorans]|nr:hypothetical protein [Serratia quinivorans]
MRQPVDDLSSQTLHRLPSKDVPTYLPIQAHQFPVDRQYSTLLGE